MSYIIIIIGGVVIAVLLLLQLRNEAGAQSRQVKTLFGNLALEVYCTPAGEKAPLTHVGQQKPRYVYPIVSTSITCGKQDGKNRYQLDLPIETGDESLKGTAAEFFIEPDDTCLHLYVRRVEQPSIWVANADRTSLRCVLEKQADPSVPPPIPAIFRKAGQRLDNYGKNGKISLWLGDEILLGDTRIVVTHDRGEG